jgi:Cu/Ag efflux protein CusF
LKGKLSYPEPNEGLYEFTNDDQDVGKFKAPTLRNIAVTAPYMHDGSVRTLEDVVEHYRAGGRKIDDGPYAGNGFANPNKSEFVKSFSLSSEEKNDLLEFLRSLTDENFLHNPDFSNPWLPAPARRPVTVAGRPLHGTVVQVYAEDGSISLYHDDVPGLLGAMRAPYAMEFVVSDRTQLKALRPGQAIVALVHKQGNDYVLDNLRALPVGRNKAGK